MKSPFDRMMRAERKPFGVIIICSGCGKRKSASQEGVRCRCGCPREIVCKESEFPRHRQEAQPCR